MAEKKPQQSDAAAPAGTTPPKKGKLKLLIVVSAIMAVEGVGVFYVANMLSASPDSASASTDDGLTDDHAADGHGAAEVAGHAEDAAHKSKNDSGSGGHDAPKGGDAHGHGKGNPPTAGQPATVPPADGMTEIEVADSRLHNVRSGRSMIVRIKVSVLVLSQRADLMKSMIDQRKARLHERVSSVVRNAEPKLLDEPGLETLKRQLKFELTQVIGDPELIKEVLIPELLHD